MKLRSRSLGSLGSLIVCLIAIDAVSAQIVPDNTLPVNSRVEAGCTTCTIEGGTAQGNNLFHSFREFSIPRNGAAFFNNGVQIQTILTRVTGNSISNIDGLLRTNGTANLFLINPNGVIFGANARLDVRGAVVVSTATAIAFPGGNVFSASNPAPPDPLLTINPNALLFNQLNPQPIINRSRADTTGLTTAPGQSFALIGGDVRLEGGQIRAAAGRVELGGLSTAGIVGLNLNQGKLDLSFPEGIDRANVLLNNGAQVNVRSSSGGAIVIHAQDFTLLGRTTQLLAGIDSNSGFPGAQAGDIQIDAPGLVRLDAGTISNQVRPGAIGKGGNIRIQAGAILGTNGAVIGAPVFGQGDGGDVIIHARGSVSFDSRASTRVGGIISGIQDGGVGNGGRIDITARSVSLTNASGVGTGSSGRGNAGDITIHASDAVFLEGGNGILSGVDPGTIGNGGSITLTTGTLWLTNGSQVGSSIGGQGRAGDITIEAHDTVSISGVRQGRFPIPSGIGSSINGGEGKGGNIRITTGSLVVTDGGYVSVGTTGVGDAGKIGIQARDRVVFDGVSRNGFRAEASSISGAGAVGDGGDISIQTRSLSVTNGAALTASSAGRGRAGNVVIDAEAIQVSGGDFDSVAMGEILPYTSGIYSATEGATDRGGDIRITTHRLQVSEGAVVNAQTSGDQPGGNIQVDASAVELSSGGEIVTSAYSSGNAGNIRINATNQLILTGFDPVFEQRLTQFGRGQIAPATASSGLFAQAEETGQAGNIVVQTPQLIVRDRAQILASTAQASRGGNIQLTVPGQLQLENRGQIAASTRSGTAGSVDVVAGAVELSGNALLSVEAGRGGIAGDLNITTRQLSADNSSVTVSNPQGQAGSLNIRAADIRLRDRAKLIAEAGGEDPPGITRQAEIQLQDANLLLLRNGSLISARAGDSANGGNIIINAANGFVVAVPDENSDIIASASRGNGGRITITTQGIFGLQTRDRPSSLSDINASSEFGFSGVITLNTLDVDPSRGLTELPADIVDASRSIAVGCTSEAATQANRGSFYQTGRGGIATLPGDPVGSSDILEDLQPPQSWSAATRPQGAIVEAQAWQISDRGEVMLVAAPRYRWRCGR